ncbi:MAG TPA: sigma-70 family RNA polymerase sigma factor [Candidatus Eisenbacteria bacterium]|nr:sigma-70 family RNA polymerase sigma factor [Candidatus Eisenbacteria bacterium]
MRDVPPVPGRPPLGSGDMDSTVNLLKRIRSGEERAREILLQRYMPVLKRLARGKVPIRARPLVDTDELVQRTMYAVFTRVDSFEHRHEGAFLAYLRTVLKNKILDIARQSNPEVTEMDGAMPDLGPSPVELVIGKERLEAYDAALEALNEQQRQAVIMRLEMGFTYEEIAVAVDCPSANAARMLISRALARMAISMSAHQDDLV